MLSQEKIKNIINDPQAGVYLIDKPKGEHSFDTVSKLRKILNIKRIGFAGTLDPLASGLLIVATGRATRLLDYFHKFTKVYEADILFGQQSDSYDLDGRIAINQDVKEFSLTELKEQLAKFMGKQKQFAPLYSAKKVKGEKLHKLARRGELIDLPVSEIEIFNLQILSFNYPHLSLQVECSAGTYIRSLAHDLGKAMGTGALLSDLRRTKIGHWSVSEAFRLAESEEVVDKKLPLLEIIGSLGLSHVR